MALVKGASVGLGAVAMAADLGSHLKLVLETDSSAARGMGLRRGVGKVRHLHTLLLWVQKRIQRGDLAVHKIAGETNVSDLGTKFLAAKYLDRDLAPYRFVVERRKSSMSMRASLCNLKQVVFPRYLDILVRLVRRSVYR